MRSVETFVSCLLRIADVKSKNHLKNFVSSVSELAIFCSRHNSQTAEGIDLKFGGYVP